MNEDAAKSKTLTDIRKRAEEIVRRKTEDLQHIPDKDIKSLVNELQVHQIELEMQNEELRRVQNELEDARNRYSDLYDFAPIGYFTFDKNGVILQVNLAGAKKLGRERSYLIKKPFSLYIASDYKDAFYLHLKEVFNNEKQMICELRLVETSGNIFDVMLESMPVRDSNGDLMARTAMSDITERKRAEKVSQDARIYAESIIDTVRKPFVALDKDLKVLSANRSFYSTFEVTPDETVGNLIYDIGNRQWDIPSLRKLLEEILPQKTQFIDYEVSHKFQTIGQKIMLLNARQIYQEVIGTPIILLAIEDITEKRQIEKVSQEARKYAESIIDTVREPFVAMDKDLKVLSANRSFYSTFEVTPDETVGNLIYDIGNRQWDIPSLRTLLEEILPKKTEFLNYEVSHKFQTIGQKIMLLNARQIYQEVIGTPIILLAIEDITEKRSLEDELRKYRENLEKKVEERTAELKMANEQLQLDITERKQNEKALLESEERYRHLVEFSPYGIAIHSNDKLVYMNVAGAQILGAKNPEDFIGKTVLQIIHPDYHDIFRERIRIQEQGKVAPPLEEKFLRLDGTSVDVEFASTPFTYMGKQAIYGVFRDITERKKAEEVHTENLRLEAADKAKSEFLANMSHELRTPLNSIIGFSELMKEGMAGKLDEKQKHFIDNIFTSGTFLLSLINDILDLSKIEAGKIELEPEKMSVPVTINETLSLMKEKAMKHKVQLKTEIDPELEFIEADKQRFKQVLFNLLSNAVKFSKEEGGTVTIRTKKEGDMVQISVSDTGIGIKEENIVKLFHKFEQLESGIGHKYGGTGLGLAITKQLVELHGGKIYAESKQGMGSTFTFLIPLKSKTGEK